jgi:hypothetical protein
MTTTHDRAPTTTVPDPEPRVRLRPPSPTAMRFVNIAVRRALTTRMLGRRMERQALLEFTGRRTGRRRRVPVCLHVVDGRAVVMTKREWRLNFVDGAPVTVTHRGQRRSARARLVESTPDGVGHAVRAALDGGASPFDLGLKITPRGYEPTARDLAALPLGLVHIDFDAE